MKALLSVLKYIFFLSIGIILFWYVVKDVDTQDIVKNFRNANYFYIGLAMIIALLSHFIRAYRWVLLIKPLGQNVSPKNAFMAVLMGYAANYALPRAGEITRCVILKRTNGLPLSKLIGTVMIERIVDVISLFILIVLTLILEFSKLKALATSLTQNSQSAGSFGIKLLIIFAAFVLLAGIAYVFRARIKKSKYYLKVREIIVGLIEGVKTIKTMENKWNFIIQSFLLWFTYWLMAYLMLFSIEPTSHLNGLAALTLLVVGGIAFALPVQGAIGTFHAAAVIGLSLYQITKADAFVYGFISHTSQMILLLLAGAGSYVLFLFMMRKNKNEPGTENTEQNTVVEASV